MKFRLKDRDLQRKLDEISGGDFSPRLQDVWSKNEGRSVATFSFGDERDDDVILRKFSVTIYEDEIVAVPEYAPRAWNKFPEVTPPREQDMRVEMGEGCGYMAWWDGYNWRTGSHHYQKASYLENVKRFRPRVDPNEENKE